MDEHIFPAEQIYADQMEEFTKQGNRWQVPEILEDKKKIADYSKIVKSPSKIKKELIKELNEVSDKLEKIMNAKEKQKKENYKKK